MIVTTREINDEEVVFNLGSKYSISGAVTCLKKVDGLRVMAVPDDNYSGYESELVYLLEVDPDTDLVEIIEYPLTDSGYVRRFPVLSEHLNWTYRVETEHSLVNRVGSKEQRLQQEIDELHEENESLNRIISELEERVDDLQDEGENMSKSYFDLKRKYDSLVRQLENDESESEHQPITFHVPVEYIGRMPKKKKRPWHKEDNDGDSDYLPS